MSSFEESMGDALGVGQRKSNNTRSLKSTRSKASKTSGGSTEVMAKVTGFSKGASHAKSNLEYISRNGDVKLENERGEVIEGGKELREFAKSWVAEFGDGKRHKNQRDTMHLIMSMPAGTDAEAVRRATREFARKTFASNHEYVMALHEDTKNPHCHLTVKCLGHNGKRLNPRKADLQEWRERFAVEMEAEGYMADATPRRSRGVVKKPKRQELIHIEQRGVSKVAAAQVKDAAAEVVKEAKGGVLEPKPWDVAIKKTQATVRSAWLAAAIALEVQAARIKQIQKEYPNERPDYSQSNTRDVHQRRRAAAVLQSGTFDAKRELPAPIVASLRNLSAIDVVHDRRPAQVLLQSDARNRLGRESRRTPDTEVRREGVSVNPAPEGNGKGNGGLSDQKLAEQIRGFVKAMPPIETAQDQLRRDLQARFTKTAEIQQPTPTPAPAKQEPAAPDKAREQAQELGKQNDIELDR